MKTDIENLNTVQRKIHVTVDSAEVNAHFEKAYAKIQKKAHIKGFRPGKAPISIIKKLYGHNVKPEVGEAIINDKLPEAMKSHALKPVANPNIEVETLPEQNSEFLFKAIVDVMPEIEIGNYTGIPLNIDRFNVKEERVAKELHNLRRRRGKPEALEVSDAVIKMNRLATIGHTVYEGEQLVPELSTKGLQILIGEDEIHPEIESALLGMKVEETKSVNVTLPENYGDVKLAGKTLRFDVVVEDVKDFILPELNDELAKDLGTENVEDLTNKVRDQLVNKAEEMRQNRIESLILDYLYEGNPFEVPPSMTDHVIDSIIEEIYWQDEKERKEALKNTQMRKDVLPEAKRRAQNTLLLLRVAEKENLKVEEEDLNAEVERMFPHTKGNEQKIKETREAVGARMRDSLLLRKTMRLLQEKAIITENNVDL